MLKNKNFALGTAALLLSTTGFTACSSEDTFTGSSFTGEAVKTQFAINIPTSGVNGRMTANNTQQSGNFLGMHNIKLIPMTEAGAADKTFSSVLSLENIGSFSTQNTKVYQNVNIPVGTKNFLFYGAGNADDPQNDDERFAEGVLTQNVGGNSTSNITFQLQAAKLTTDTEADKLKTVLNNVAGILATASGSNAEIGDIYTNFKNLKSGSANSILKTLESLYNSVNAISGQQTVAEQIKTAMTEDGTFSYDNGFSTDLTYPENINMPDGAAVLSFAGSEFTYTNATMGTGDKAMNLDMDAVCFPASIYYFANTPVKATNTEVLESAWPATTGWSAFINSWDNVVSATTRSIALANPIQYGVANLALKVKCAKNLLEDNKGTQISVPDTKGYTITGVLIGGQPDKAGWNFEPASDAKFEKVVYDKNMNGTVAATTSESATNYTLVMANTQSPAAKVNIAIELVNNGADFYGVDGIVPAGAKFYLVAQLDPAAASNNNGVSDVFKQDYTTTATLTISSLKNAYNTIPDLRASKLSLGLTVDLTWEAGMVFDNVEIL